MASNLQSPDPMSGYVDTSRYEQFDGQLVERPVPSLLHARIQKRLLFLLEPLAKEHEFEILPEASIDQTDVPHSDWLTPDILVGKIPIKVSARGHVLPPLFLVIEIVSPGQSIGVMMRKVERYLSHWGVEHVWLIEPEKQFAALVSNANKEPQLVWPALDLYAGDQGFRIPFEDVLKPADSTSI